MIYLLRFQWGCYLLHFGWFCELAGIGFELYQTIDYSKNPIFFIIQENQINEL